MSIVKLNLNRHRDFYENAVKDVRNFDVDENYTALKLLVGRLVVAYTDNEPGGYPSVITAIGYDANGWHVYGDFLRIYANERKEFKRFKLMPRLKTPYVCGYLDDGRLIAGYLYRVFIPTGCAEICCPQDDGIYKVPLKTLRNDEFKLIYECISKEAE